MKRYKMEYDYRGQDSKGEPCIVRCRRVEEAYSVGDLLSGLYALGKPFRPPVDIVSLRISETV